MPSSGWRWYFSFFSSFWMSERPIMSLSFEFWCLFSWLAFNERPPFSFSCVGNPMHVQKPTKEVKSQLTAPFPAFNIAPERRGKFSSRWILYQYSNSAHQHRVGMPEFHRRIYESRQEIEVEGLFPFETSVFGSFCSFSSFSGGYPIFKLNCGVNIRDLRLKRGRPSDSLV